MAFPVVGTLYYGGRINGFGPVVWTQPGGPGTQVSPAAPTQYPVVYQGFPQQPFAYEGLFSFGCGHWCNTCEVFEAREPNSGEVAAICCCPVCSYVILVVVPVSDWFNVFYSIYPLGLPNRTYTNPNENPNLP